MEESNIKTWLLYLSVSVIILWWLVYRHAQALDTQRAALLHFMTCPKCRGARPVAEPPKAQDDDGKL